MEITTIIVKNDGGGKANTIKEPNVKFSIYKKLVIDSVSNIRIKGINVV